jgi:hypothetical protein
VPVRRLAGAVLGTYGCLVVAASARLAARNRDPGLLVAMPVVFVATHVAYGTGSIAGILEPAGRRR